MRIRPASQSDLPLVHALAPRLVEFGEVPGREPARMVARDRHVLAAALENPSPDTELFVAEEDDGRAVGFVHLTTTTDYYSEATTGHIADLVVAPEAGGRGVGSALVAQAEAWARARGLSMLTLNVFTANTRARRLYGRLGFDEESIHCVKRLF